MTYSQLIAAAFHLQRKGAMQQAAVLDQIKDELSERNPCEVGLTAEQAAWAYCIAESDARAIRSEWGLVQGDTILTFDAFFSDSLGITLS